MQQFWNNPVQLINVNQISDEQLLKQQLDGILALTLKHSRDKEVSDTLYKIINKFAEIGIQDPVELQFANTIVSHVFNISDINNQEKALDTIESLSEPLRDEIMTAAERFEQNGIKRGIIQGIEQTKVDMVINCLKEGAHIKFIAKEHQLDV